MIELSGPDAPFAVESALRTWPMPTVLWIELTSRCPFDCVFCSRKLLRGNGRHMDFALYQRLIGELQSPQVIRLNYSGESVHYPHLIEACELAAATGAAVELVTALAALPATKLAGLACSGLTRLTISLHTLDAEQFEAIYRFGNVGGMRDHIETLLAHAADAPRPLQVDFAFVAMRRNLNQLLAVVAYAAQLGLQRVQVHPVIRRDPIDETFTEELDGERLRPEFLADLASTVAAASTAYPAIAIEVSTPEIGACQSLDANPRYFPNELPHGARIHGCDQDPWQTVHVLADGRVVSCEVRDQISLGSLLASSLAEIWHGSRYREFRAAYLQASDVHCRACPYKQAYLPGPFPRHLIPGRFGSSSLKGGWHAEEAGLVWSTRRALLTMDGRGGDQLQLRLLMESAANGGGGASVHCNGELIATLDNHGARTQERAVSYRIRADGPVHIELRVDRLFRPGAGSSDLRELGVALLEASVGDRQ